MILDYAEEKAKVMDFNETLSDLQFELRSFDLDEKKKSFLNRAFRIIQDELNILDFEALTKISSYAKFEDKKIRTEIQGNIRLYKRSHNEYIKMFLMNYLRKKEPTYLFSTQEFVDLG